MIRRIVYTLNVSLDGFINSPSGSLEWANVDDEVHGWFNEEARKAAAFVYGRRMYETMAAYWPTAESDPAATPEMRDFAVIWNRTPKIVFSNSLVSVRGNSRLVRGGVGGELARLNSEFDGELQIGGADLAAQFIRAALVDEFGLIVHPVLLGGGTPFFPPSSLARELRLVETKAFGNGAVHLRYRRA